jgi:hypothetical protein
MKQIVMRQHPTTNPMQRSSSRIGLRIVSSIRSLLMMMTIALLLVACDSHEHDHEHEHGHGHDHKHGPANAGSVSAKSASQTASPAKHEHHAPHGGSLVELGEEYAHLELVLDQATGKLTAYALDGEAEKSVRIKQPTITLEIAVQDKVTTVELGAVANVLTGETVGDSSQFEAVIEALRGVSKFQGSVATVTIKGQTFERVKFDFTFGETGHDHKHP